MPDAPESPVKIILDTVLTWARAQWVSILVCLALSAVSFYTGHGCGYDSGSAAVKAKPVPCAPEIARILNGAKK